MKPADQGRQITGRRTGSLGDWLTLLTTLLAPLAGVFAFFFANGSFTADVIWLGWIVATIVTVAVGFPLGFCYSLFLRAAEAESLPAYVLGAMGISIAIALMIGDVPLGVGLFTTAIILAVTFWFGVARPRVMST